MRPFRHFAPKKYKCLSCGRSPLEIWAVHWGKDYVKGQGDLCLVCSDKTGNRGCGTVFGLAEYDLEDEDLINYSVDYTDRMADDAGGITPEPTSILPLVKRRERILENVIENRR